MEDQAREKANFCLATGIAPSEYDLMTRYEITAFTEEHNKRNQK